MKKLFLVAMSVILCVALVVPALAGKIAVKQSQTQGIVQGQASAGGFSASTQTYASGAQQAYGIAKAPTPGSPSAGFAAASTGNNTTGSQVRFGSGVNAQGMIGATTNNGSLAW
jgi:hypothetical protein